MQDGLRYLTEARDEGAPWAARGDFARCFDEIPRARLLDRLAKVVPDAELVDSSEPSCTGPSRADRNTA